MKVYDIDLDDREVGYVLDGLTCLIDEWTRRIKPDEPFDAETMLTALEEVAEISKLIGRIGAIYKGKDE